MAHNYTRLFYHFVWATWDRTPLLTEEVKMHAYALIRHQCAEQHCKVFALGGVEDHVHLLVSLPTTLPVSDFIKAIKGVSSRALNDRLGRPTWSFKWQGRYGVITVCPSHVGLIRGYVEGQQLHHDAGNLWPSCEKAETKEEEAPGVRRWRSIPESVPGLKSGL